MGYGRGLGFGGYCPGGMGGTPTTRTDVLVDKLEKWVYTM